MHLHIVEPKNAEQLYNRLRETDAILLRAAETDDRLEYIRTRDFAADGPVSFETIKAVRDRLVSEMAEFTQSDWWTTQTWNI